MRKTARALVVVFLSVLMTVILGIASAFVSAFALGATTALIVPGTGTPDAAAVMNYMQNARTRYLAPFTSCTGATCNLEGVKYPASFWPLGFIGNWCPGFQCDTWNESVGTGVDQLDSQLRGLLADPTNEVVIFGYSQGGAVVSNELRNLDDLTPAERERVTAVVIGNAYNPDGGIFTRLGFLPTIPFLNVTFGPAMPTDTGIPITSIGFEYDPVMYAPLYWGNPFAMLNALAAFDNVHGYYLTPNGNSPAPIAYGYTQAELAEILGPECPSANCRLDSNGNKYYMIPAKSLPIVNAVMGALPAPLQPVAKPVADLVSPVLKVLIDLGYDWSGDPGQERWLSPLPFNPIQNWPAVGVNLVAATIQGIQAFINDLGGLTTIAPATTAPTPVSTLAAARVSTSTETTDEVSETKESTPKLTVVKDSETAVQQAAVENDTASTSKDVPPATKSEETTTKPEATPDDKTSSDETKADDKKADETKADTEKKADETKADTEKKSDTDKKSETDKKDADSEKAAA
jgi:pimeloyl-ACP methyl ester carboxylesterase